MRSLSVALVHYPVLARDGSTVTTAITNLDLHDIARSCFTYGVLRYYIIHPVAAQRELAARVQTHWTTGSGATRIPDRKPPMEQIHICPSLEDAQAHCASLGEGSVDTWVTSAQPLPSAISHAEARRRLEQAGPPVLLVLGTGWGLAKSVTESATESLLPIISPRSDGYNHLSVRAAAAIFLDRLVGGEVPGKSE